MNYEIITDRFEVEKLAEDIFLSDYKLITHIDYDDLCALKRHGTFKHAIICDVELENEAWVNELIDVIQSQQLSLDTLQAFLLHMIVGDEDISSYKEDLYEFFQFLDSVKSNNCIDGYSIFSKCSSFPKGTIRIQLMFTYKKTEQDKQED